MKYLMLSCFAATRLMEKRLSVQGITFWENMQLKMHLRMCDHCRAFAEQSVTIETAIHRQIESIEADETNSDGEPPVLPEALKKHIMEKLGL